MMLLEIKNSFAANNTSSVFAQEGLNDSYTDIFLEKIHGVAINSFKMYTFLLAGVVAYVSLFHTVTVWNRAKTGIDKIKAISFGVLGGSVAIGIALSSMYSDVNNCIPNEN